MINKLPLKNESSRKLGLASLESKKYREKNLKKELAEKEKQIEEYKDDLQRLQAEFENYIKRSEKEKEKFKENANYELMLKLLHIIDSFEKAIAELKRTNNEYSNGIEMIYTQLIKILEEEGIKPINSVGEKLDPYKHEVIKQIEKEVEQGKIIEEIQKGYMFKDKVIRPSKVIIANGGNQNE